MITLKKYNSSDVFKSTYILKKFNDNYYRLVYLKGCRQKGFESITNKKIRKTLKLMGIGLIWVNYHNLHSKNLYNKFIKLSKLYYMRLDSSISRTKSKIFEYCICNNFDYFVTLTINSDKYDRYNLSLFYNDFSQFIRNYRRKYNLDIQYLFVPEQHKNGAWHLHGLIKGIPLEHFTINDNGYLDWLVYKEKFGFISLDKIKDNYACSIYMTKYITKDFYFNNKLNRGYKMYYCSRGLKKASEIYRGNIFGEVYNKPDFYNDYCKIYNFNDINDLKIK